MLPALGLAFAPGMTGAAKAVRVLSFILVVIGLLLLSYCKGREDGENKVQLGIQKAMTEQYRKGQAAGEKAAEQRLTDERARLEMEKEYEDAIASAPGGRNSPAAVALACQRLRRANPGADLPAECGPAGGNGS